MARTAWGRLSGRVASAVGHRVQWNLLELLSQHRRMGAQGVGQRTFFGPQGGELVEQGKRGHTVFGHQAGLKRVLELAFQQALLQCGRYRLALGP